MNKWESRSFCRKKKNFIFTVKMWKSGKTTHLKFNIYKKWIFQYLLSNSCKKKKTTSIKKFIFFSLSFSGKYYSLRNFKLVIEGIRNWGGWIKVIGFKGRICTSGRARDKAKRGVRLQCPTHWPTEEVLWANNMGHKQTVQ